MKALQVTGGFASGCSTSLLAGLMLFGGGGVATVAAAQDVVAAGGGHSCAVVGGHLQCWGSNNYGQLGNGTTRTSVAPTPVIGLSGTVTASAAGSSHTCAIVDGGLECWGYNEQGQLGTGNADSSTVPVEVFPPGSDVIAVATGRYHSCAVVSGGLKCWGDNSSGQLGINSTDPSNVPMNVFPSGTGVTAVAAGGSHTCAVSNSEVRCWGANSFGQLGTGNNDPSLTPVLVSGPITNAVAVATGSAHSCALLDNAGVRCWGDNRHGQLGNDTFDNSQIPAMVYTHTESPPQSLPLSGVLAITAGNNHTCATTAGGAYCWGYGEYGQLGFNLTTDFNFARHVYAAPPTATAAGSAHTCAIAEGSVFCWGSDASGQLGDAGASPYVPTPAMAMTGFQHVSAGDRHGCATSAGAAYCWGSNLYGQLGTGTSTNGATPQVVSGLEPGSGVALIAAGGYHSCAKTGTALGTVSCWGENGYGQLGNGGNTDSPTPIAIAGLSDTVSLATGFSHTCVARNGGSVQCWGSNSNGQLGNGMSGNNSPMPVTVQIGPFVPLTGATTVTTGAAHSCAMVNDGARCWGANSQGQLGNGSTNDAHGASAVVGLGTGSGVTMMSAGWSHTCAVVNEEAQCWGWNVAGQLGNGTNDDSTIPTAVSGLDSGVIAVASGGAHACAVIDGGVKCWGDNSSGQLGDGSFVGSNVPVTALPPGSSIHHITAGADYTCATGTAEGEVWCWGNGMFGKLANGKLGYEDAPVEVAIFGNGFEPAQP